MSLALFGLGVFGNPFRTFSADPRYPLGYRTVCRLCDRNLKISLLGFLCINSMNKILTLPSFFSRLTRGTMWPGVKVRAYEQGFSKRFGSFYRFPWNCVIVIALTCDEDYAHATQMKIKPEVMNDEILGFSSGSNLSGLFDSSSFGPC